MGLQVVGAGHGRTGTYSQKLALEKLLGAPCYHMREVFKRKSDVEVWRRAADGVMPDWDQFFGGYSAAVDWPMALFWEEIASAFPDALILLSVRDPEEWWTSASNTIFNFNKQTESPAFQEMVSAITDTRFTPDYLDKDASIAAFNAHNKKVRDTIPPKRLLEYSVDQGWEPLCHALDLPVPDEPFPVSNTSEEWNKKKKSAFTSVTDE